MGWRPMLLLVAAAATGCSATTTAKLAVAPVERTSFEFADRRPPNNRVSSRSEEPDGTEVTIYGDDAISPPTPVLIKSWLQRNAADWLTGRRVELNSVIIRVSDPPAKLDEDRVYRNTPPVAHRFAPLFSVLAEAIRANATSEKLATAGIYGKVDGESFSAVGQQRFPGTVTEQDLNSVIESALAEAVADMQRVLARLAAPAEPMEQESAAPQAGEQSTATVDTPSADAR